MKPLLPLVAERGIGLNTAGLRSMLHLLEEARVPKIVEYLSRSPSILAIMGYSGDELGAAFSDVVGGPAILSDGTYFWRRDGAAYVEFYAIGLPDEFLRHGDAVEWEVPLFSQERIIEVDRELRPFWQGGNTGRV